MTAGQRGATPLDLRMFLALEGLPALKARLAAVMVLASEAAMFGPALGAMAVGEVRVLRAGRWESISSEAGSGRTSGVPSGVSMM